MKFIFEQIGEALVLIIHLDREFLFICWTSIWIATVSTTLAAAVSLPIAFIIAMNKFKGKTLLLNFLTALIALPTVVIGLFVYSLICRYGIFGKLELLYTPYAMIIGQFIFITPLITALVIASFEAADERIIKTAVTLGANKLYSFITLTNEIRNPILVAILNGFARAFGEIGISMMLGGNIKNYTRNITTAMAFEVAKGNFPLSMALGIILLVIAFVVNLSSQFFLRKK